VPFSGQLVVDPCPETLMTETPTPTPAPEPEPGDEPERYEPPDTAEPVPERPAEGDDDGDDETEAE